VPARVLGPVRVLGPERVRALDPVRALVLGPVRVPARVPALVTVWLEMASSCLRRRSRRSRLPI
jgi:hypothetical protein